MPRAKSYDLEELLKLADQYKIDNPMLRITIPNFGNYLRLKGYQIQDHTLRRDEELKSYIDALNISDEDKIFNDLVSYKTLDVDAFLLKNNTIIKLKEALTVRDQYYASIASSAVEAIKHKNVLQRKIDECNQNIVELNNKITMLNNELEIAKINKNKSGFQDETIIKLKSLLDDYVYPDVANSILKREGILEVVNNIVNDKKIDNLMIYADTNIYAEDNSSSLIFDSVNDLLGEFDE